MRMGDSVFVERLAGEADRQRAIGQWRRARACWLVATLGWFVGALVAFAGGAIALCGLYCGVAALSLGAFVSADMKIKVALLIERFGRA